MPNGGIRIVEKSAESYGYKVDDEVEYIYHNLRKTHNDGVFQVYTKDMIYEQVWGTTIAIDDNAIMVYINRLRSKIEKDRQKPEHIITVRGMGYRFLP